MLKQLQQVIAILGKEGTLSLEIHGLDGFADGIDVGVNLEIPLVHYPQESLIGLSGRVDGPREADTICIQLLQSLRYVIANKRVVRGLSIANGRLAEYDYDHVQIGFRHYRGQKAQFYTVAVKIGCALGDSTHRSFVPGTRLSDSRDLAGQRRCFRNGGVQVGTDVCQRNVFVLEYKKLLESFQDLGFFSPDPSEVGLDRQDKRFPVGVLHGLRNHHHNVPHATLDVHIHCPSFEIEVPMHQVVAAFGPEQVLEPIGNSESRSQPGININLCQLGANYQQAAARAFMFRLAFQKLRHF